MANKKGEGVRGMLGVRGVMGDLVTKNAEQKLQPPQAAEITEAVSPHEHQAEPSHAHAEQGAEAVEFSPTANRPSKKATGIKGRPRVKKDEHAAPKGEKTKVTLSIDEILRDQFYRLAHGEMIQPGEFVERALRYYIKHHTKHN